MWGAGAHGWSVTSRSSSSMEADGKVETVLFT